MMAHKSSGLFTALVPDVVAVAEASDDRDARPLFPEESQVVAGAVEKRLREFTTVRSLARDCLSAFGERPAPLLPDSDRVPRWPSGYVGSMTHCDGLRAAAVVRTADVEAIGIDAERDVPLPAGVLERVSLPSERGPLAELAARCPDVSWDRLLFSAKESVFKTWFPVTRHWLKFTDCVVEFEPDTGRFLAMLHVSRDLPGPVKMRTLSGRWISSRVAGRPLIGTAITVS